MRYLLAGGSIAALYLAVFTAAVLLRPAWHYFASFAVAQVVTIAVAFPVYRRWVFLSRGSLLGDWARFLSVWATSLIGSAVSLPLLVDVLGMQPVPAQVIAVVVLSIGSYLGHRFVSFRHR